MTGKWKYFTFPIEFCVLRIKRVRPGCVGLRQRLKGRCPRRHKRQPHRRAEDTQFQAPLTNSSHSTNEASNLCWLLFYMWSFSCWFLRLLQYHVGCGSVAGPRYEPHLRSCICNNRVIINHPHSNIGRARARCSRPRRKVSGNMQTTSFYCSRMIVKNRTNGLFSLPCRKY